LKQIRVLGALGTLEHHNQTVSSLNNSSQLFKLGEEQLAYMQVHICGIKSMVERMSALNLQRIRFGMPIMMVNSHLMIGQRVNSVDGLHPQSNSTQAVRFYVGKTLI